jgi:probable rRNA maturation factor
VNFSVYNRQKALAISKSSVRRVLEGLCSFLRIQCEEISVYFVSEKKICQLHVEFFNDPSPTDCISFPVDDAYLGDVFICPNAALRFDPARPYEETLLYLIHGILHLIGYDDIEPKAKRSMRKMEKKCMDHLKQLKLKITPP